MPKEFTANLEVKCWKEHECCSCGTVYRYKFQRKKKGQGPTEAEATAVATSQAVADLKNQVEIRPCPTCGLVQPDMVSHWRARRHALVFLIGLLVFAAVFVLGAIDNIPKNVALWLAVGCTGFFLLGHLLVALRPFNNNLQANCERAQEEIDTGTMQVSRKSKGHIGDSENLFHQRGGFVCFFLFLIGMVLMPSAEVVRKALGWTWNASWHPGVAGPMDRTYTWFPITLETVGGLWRGEAHARVENAVELGLKDDLVHSETATDTWGETIKVKVRDSDKTTRFWVRILVPEIPDSLGKTLRVHINLKVTYPARRGKDKYEVVEKLLENTETLILGAPGAGRTYVLLWWLSGVGGACLVVGSGFALVGRADLLKQKARPTRVYPLGGPGGTVTAEDLVAASRIKVTGTDPNVPANIDQLQRRAARSRWWFLFFLFMMPVIFFSLLFLMVLMKDTADIIITFAICFVLFLMVLVCAILKWIDKRQNERLLREKVAQVAQEPPQKPKRIEREEDRPRRRRRDRGN